MNNVKKAVPERCGDGHNGPCLSEHQYLSRIVAVQVFLETNGLIDGWCRAANQVAGPLEEVLKRLPESDFEVVSKNVRVHALKRNTVGVNIRGWANRPGAVYTVVFCHDGLNLSHDALVGLVAHELAHTFDEVSDEAATDAKARSWGFDLQLACLYRELGYPAPTVGP